MAKTPSTTTKSKNHLINGALDFWQRGTSFATIANEAYSADRWVYRKVGAMVHTVQRSTDVPASSDSLYSLEMALTTPDDTISGSDFCAIEQRIEGNNFRELIGKKATLHFWVKAGIVGDYIARFQRFGGAVISDEIYTINVVNTWEKKSITIDIPDDGSFNLDNQAAIRVGFFLALVGSAMINGVATGAGSFKISDVMLHEGPEAVEFERAGDNIGEELNFCRRYYQKDFDFQPHGTIDIINRVRFINKLSPFMRATPSVSLISGISLVNAIDIMGKDGAVDITTLSSSGGTTETSLNYILNLTSATTHAISDSVNLKSNIIQAEAEL